jgi:hypothetical protein
MTIDVAAVLREATTEDAELWQAAWREAPYGDWSPLCEPTDRDTAAKARNKKRDSMRAGAQVRLTKVANAT